MTETTTILNELQNEKINTWFVLGLFIDRFKERHSKSAFKENKDSFDTHLENGGIAFLTFYSCGWGVGAVFKVYFSRFYPP